jgi:hypothetical protein
MKDQDVLPNCGDRGGKEKKRKYEGSSVSPHSDPHHRINTLAPHVGAAATRPDFSIE